MEHFKNNSLRSISSRILKMFFFPSGTFVLVTIIVVILHTTKGFILQNLPTTGFEATKHSQTTASTKLESSHNSAGVSGPNFHHSASQSSKHTLDTLVLDIDNFIQSIVSILCFLAYLSLSFDNVTT